MQSVLGKEFGKGHSFIPFEPDAKCGTVHAYFCGNVIQGDWVDVMCYDIFADLLHALYVAVQGACF